MAKNKTTKKVIKFGRFRYAAASLIFALIAGLCFVSPPEDTEQVYNDNFMAYEDGITEELDLMLSTRSGGEDDEATKALRKIKEGMEFYNNKEYTQAIPIFKEYLSNNKDASDYDEIDFYLGVSYLSKGEADKGTDIFERLVDSEDQGVQEDAKWYLTLAYARAKKVDEAKTLLKELVDSEKYGAKASKILNPTRRTTFK